MGRTRTTEHIAKTTPAIENERLKALRELLPEAFTEEALDLEKLQAVLGTHTASGPERYSFSWAGKRAAISALQTPSDATLTPDKKHSIKFDTTRNVFIEGDNLEVLKLLYKPYFGMVKMIYIDPPYNTGNDFVYPDDYKHPIDTYLRLTGQKKEDGSLSTSNPETSGRYHSAWLTMMYPRLFLARQLLTEDGVIFVSIDDHEVHHLRLLLNEIFGEENFIEQFVIRSNPRGNQAKKFTASVHEYILLYARRKELISPLGFPVAEENYEKVDEDGRKYREIGLRKRGAGALREDAPNQYYPIFYNPSTKDLSTVNRTTECIRILPTLSDGADGRWRWAKDTVEREKDKLIVRPVRRNGTEELDVFERDYHAEDTLSKIKSIFYEKEVNYENATEELKALFDGKKVFDYPKPTYLITQLLASINDKHSIVLDWFAGSCTTAQAVLELNREDGGTRRFIMVQLPEPLDEPKKLKDGTALNTIADIGRERIARVIAQMRADRQTTLGEPHAEDLGFRFFRLTPSNYKSFDDSPQTTVDGFAERLAAVIDPLVPGWKPEPVIYEVALKEGFGLSLTVERVDGKLDFFRVTDPDKEQSFLVCLDDKVSLSNLKCLGLKKTDLFICRDTALDDTSAANLALQCRLKTI